MRRNLFKDTPEQTNKLYYILLMTRKIIFVDRVLFVL